MVDIAGRALVGVVLPEVDLQEAEVALPEVEVDFLPEMGLHVMVLLVVDRDMEDVVGVSAEVVAAVEEWCPDLSMF